MPIYYPNSGCLQMCAELATALAACKVHLFQSTDAEGQPYHPSVSSTAAELLANEANYNGYTAGGVAVPAWNAPLLDPLGGASIQSPVIQFTYQDTTGAQKNVIGGFFIVDAAGKLRVIGEFPSDVPMQAPGQGIPLTVKLVEATGLAV